MLIILIGMAVGVLPSTSLAKNPRPKICLVLAGGGALGITHVGVIKVLEKLRIPIDCISGTSMGSIVGGLYASGYTADELETLVKSAQWTDIFSDTPPRNEKSFQRKLDDRNFLVKYSLRIDDNGSIRLPMGILQGDKIDLAFLGFTLRIHNVTNFDDLPIPFRAVAADLETGEEVILSSGSVARAMKASMSIPGIFPPMIIDDKALIDGGIVNNLPIDVAQNLGADVIIAVDLQKDLKSKEDLRSVVDVVAQLVDLAIRKNKELQLKKLRPEDVLILPNTEGYTSASFDKAHELVAPGVEAANKMLDKLKQFSISEEAYNRHRIQQIKPEPNFIPVDFVELDNRSGVNNNLIFARIDTQAGEALSIETLNQDLIRLSGLGYFDEVLFDVVERNYKTGVLITVIGPAASNNNSEGRFAHIKIADEEDDKGSENSVGEKEVTKSGWKYNPFNIVRDFGNYDGSPNNLQFGINLEDDFDGNSNYNFAARLTRMPINAYGGELQIDLQIGENAKFGVELFQPLDDEAKYFFSPYLQYDIRNVSLFDGDIETARFRLSEALLGIDVGRQFDNWGELRVGVQRGIGSTKLRSGGSNIPNDGFDSGRYFVAFSYDTLDDVNFPHAGTTGGLRFTESTDLLGASVEYKHLSADLTYAKSWGRNTLLLSTGARLNLDDKIPIQGQFLLGGFLNLSGYQRDQLLVKNYTLHRAVAYRRWNAHQSGLFNLPFYGGFSLEYGGIFEDKSDLTFDTDDHIFAGSVFIGTDSVLGPIYLAYGQAEGDNRSVYFYLGRLF